LWIFLCMYYIQHCFICHPSDSTVSEDAGIEPRIVDTSALAVRSSRHSATSHPHSTTSHPHSATSHPHSTTYISPTLGYISSTTRLHLIHNSATSHPQLGYISSATRQHLIRNSATSHPQLGYISSMDEMLFNIYQPVLFRDENPAWSHKVKIFCKKRVRKCP
jgi:hypothetical protein